MMEELTKIAPAVDLNEAAEKAMQQSHDIPNSVGYSVVGGTDNPDLRKSIPMQILRNVSRGDQRKCKIHTVDGYLISKGMTAYHVDSNAIHKVEIDDLVFQTYMQGCHFFKNSDRAVNHCMSAYPALAASIVANHGSFDNYLTD